MSCSSRQHRLLYQLTRHLRQHLPLSPTQARGLALWCNGIVLARSGSLSAVATRLATWLHQSREAIRKRLREWYCPATAKKGHGAGGRGRHRRDWSMAACGPAWCHYVLGRWPADVAVVALDATTLGDRFTVLCLSLVYRRGAVPACWTVLPGNQPGAWQPHWERMLRRAAAAAGTRSVLVLTDRGLYSPRLFHAIRAVGWRPLMRINVGGYYRPAGQQDWVPLASVQPEARREQVLRGEAFKNAEGRLTCTLLAWWSPEHREPWLLVTDLDPEPISAQWYGLRGWIEQSFKRLKSAGWNCERTRITAVERLERQWLAWAAAMHWTVQVGGQEEAAEEAAWWARQKATPVAVAPSATAEPTASPRGPQREVSVFQRGWALLSQAVAVGQFLLGVWVPEDRPPFMRPQGEFG
jgi:hypothetical protein